MAKRKADRSHAESERFSPAAEYQKWCEPINYANQEKAKKEEETRVGNLDFQVRGFDKAGRSGHNPAGPKVGEHTKPAKAASRSPGPVYNITSTETALVQRKAPSHKIALKNDHGSFLDAIGAIPRPGVPPRSDPDAIGLAPVSWDGTAQGEGVLDKGDAAARHAGNGKTFGIRHDYLNQKFPKEHPGPADYDANESAKRTQQQHPPEWTMAEKLRDRRAEEAARMPGPGACHAVAWSMQQLHCSHVCLPLEAALPLLTASIFQANTPSTTLVARLGFGRGPRSNILTPLTLPSREIRKRSVFF